MPRKSPKACSPQSSPKPNIAVSPCDTFRSVLARVSQLRADSKKSEALPLVETVPDTGQCREVVQTLINLLYGLNKDTTEQFRRSLNEVTEATSRNTVHEWLCAYLLEVERRCGAANQVMDTVMTQLGMPPRLTTPPTSVPCPQNWQPIGQADRRSSPDTSANPTTTLIDAWRHNLQHDVSLLSVARLAMLDISTRYPVPNLFHTEHHTILLHYHLQVTFKNAATVIEDAELIIHALWWYRNMLQSRARNGNLPA